MTLRIGSSSRIDGRIIGPAAPNAMRLKSRGSTPFLMATLKIPSARLFIPISYEYRTRWLRVKSQSSEANAASASSG